MLNTSDSDNIKEFKDLNDDGPIAVIDRGTSMMAIPNEDYEALTKIWESEINNQNEFICQVGLCIGGRKCDYFEDLVSNLTIVVENIEFELRPKGYLLNGEDLDAEFMDTCIFGIMPLPLLLG